MHFLTSCSSADQNTFNCINIFLLVFSQALELQNKSNSFQYIWRRLISDEGGRGLYRGNQMRCDFWFTGRWAYNWSWARGCVGGGGAYKLGSLKAAVRFTFCGTIVHIVSLVAFMEQIKLIK